jgi:mitochondrial fission protein ELM1
MKVLLIKDSKAGHRNKALGLLRALKFHEEIEVLEYDLRWRSRILRPMLSSVLSRALFLPVKWFVRGLPTLDGTELVISAGGATQWLNAAVAQQYGMRNIFLGSARGTPPEAFSVIASHDPPSELPPFFRFELIPSLVTWSEAERASKSAGLAPGIAWGLIIGGDGEGVLWSEQDYLVLVETVLRQAQRYEIDLWVATSRRTPAHMEAQIRAILGESDVLAGTCFYHEPESTSISLLTMLGACSRICVTADSMSMTHESISSGRPVVAVLPRLGSGKSRMQSNLARLESKGHLVCQVLSELSIAGAEPVDGWSLVRDDPTVPLAEAVLAVV